MARGHLHGPNSKPHLIPKAECDTILREDAHFHPGQRCVMAIQPSKSKRGQMNTKETCALEGPAKAEYLSAMSRKVKGEDLDYCIACVYGGPHHGGPDCKRRPTAAEE